jgi:hypothetical protein
MKSAGNAYVGLFALCWVGFGTISGTSAETLQIAAPGFAPHGKAGVPGNFGEVFQGLLLNAAGNYYAPVVFPTTGQSVCRFRLIYRDNDADVNVTARLLRKRFALGGNAFDPPVTMAAVASSGADPTVRRAGTATIAQAQINTANSFYFVELEFPANTLEALGVEINIQPTCP